MVLVFNNVTAAYIDENAEVNISGDININSKADVNAKGIARQPERKKPGLVLPQLILLMLMPSGHIGKNAVVKSDGNIQIGTDATRADNPVRKRVRGQYSRVAGIFAVIFTKMWPKLTSEKAQRLKAKAS